MSEKAPTTPNLPTELAENYVAISAHKIGRMYGVDKETGKKIRLKEKDVLDAYGYDKEDYQGPRPEGPVSTPPEDEKPEKPEEKYPRVKKVTKSRPVIGRTAGGTGIRDMEADVATKLAENGKERAIEARKRAIEARRNSPEVALLNDKAELEVYGSRGRTYTDPETGAVIADADHPIKGKLEEIRSNRRFGTTEKERNDAADKYEAELNGLIGDDFELTQAKLIMDFREVDFTEKHKLTAQFMDEGMSAVDANERAEALYAKKDSKRLEIIKDNGLMSAEEYKAYVSKRNAAGSGKKPKPPIPPEYEYDTDEIREKLKGLKLLEQELEVARDKYALETARSRKSYLGRFATGNSWVGRKLKKIPGVQSFLDKQNGKFDQEVVEAEQDYTRRSKQVSEHTESIMQDMDYSKEQLDIYKAAGQLLQDADFERGIREHSKEENKDATRLSNWWVQNKGIKGKLKKAALVATAGLAVGASAGLATPFIAGGLLAGVGVPTVAGGVAGGSLAVHVNRRKANSLTGDTEDSLTLAGQQSKEDMRRKGSKIRSNYFSGAEQSVDDITNVTEDRTDKEMLGNRRRVRQAATIAKIAGAGAGVGISLLRGEIGLNDLNPLNNSDGPRKANNTFDNKPSTTPETPDVTSDITPETPDVTSDITPDVTDIITPEAPTGPDFSGTLDTRVPWDHMTDKLGTNGTPRIMELQGDIANNLGYTVQGHGGGGSGMIDSITGPDGTVFTDNGHINALLDYFDSQS